jgi:hypothetical protein
MAEWMTFLTRRGCWMELRDDRAVKVGHQGIVAPRHDRTAIFVD